MNVHPSSTVAEHITIKTGKVADMPHMLATNRYGTYCIPNDFKKREVPKLLRAGQVYEADTLDFLRRHVGTGDIVTGGAFVGDFFPALHEVLQSKARIHSFEPFPTSFDACAYTMALNGLTRVTLHRCAVGKEAGSAAFAVARGKSNASLAAGMHITGDADTDLHTITVPIMPIDDLLPKTRNVSLLHLDVEGFEADALRGSARILAKSKPIVVLEGAKPFQVRGYLNTLNEVAPAAGYMHVGRLDHNSVYRPSLA
ncbi:FkbM family methyltransferase [uncultured Tateyamaria sp.]|uniref:FkbM family methyltransferase n=1 Tax=Tateyamaria sp. 1078 TaxID=3417464 RepID=UPI002606AAD4|nr:FkbM family methyltransferase [uncultured Tateyamaria sp.]